MDSRVDMFLEQVGDDGPVVAHACVSLPGGPVLTFSQAVHPVQAVGGSLWDDFSDAVDSVVHVVEKGAGSVAKGAVSVAKGVARTAQAALKSPVLKVAFPVFAAANIKSPVRDAIVKNIPGGVSILKGESFAQAMAKHKDIVKAGKVAAGSVAKAGALAQAANALNSPLAAAVLAQHGVSAATVKRAGHTLAAMTAAANAERARKAGNHKAAAAHVAAMVALSRKAGVPADRAAKAGKQIYYLTLTPS